MSNGENETPDQGPDVSVAEEKPEVQPQPRKRGPYKKRAAETKPGSFAAYVANLPKPFRPRHLTEAIRIYAAEHEITGEALAKIDPHKFLKEHGLPNPLRRFRSLGVKQGKQLGPDEFDAVDPSEAVRLFAEKHEIKETHQWKFQNFQVDY